MQELVTPQKSVTATAAAELHLRSAKGGTLERLRTVRENGVQIRRIFVVSDRVAHRYSATVDEARAVLMRHLKASENWVGEAGFYAVKLLDRAAMEENQGRVPEAFRFEERHFGVFERPGETHCVRVEVTSPDLADLKIAGLDLGSKELGSFETVWEARPC